MRGRPARLLAATFLAAIFALVASPGRTDERPGFTLAVLRRDGVIIPFASYDGNRWTNRWPAQQATDVPIGLGDVPKDWWPGGQVRTEWTAWLTTGATRPIKVEAPVLVSVHCTRRVGLRTDFVALEPTPPPDFQPYPKSGLAVAGPASVVVERVELVPTTSPEAKGFADSVKSGVDSIETKSVKAWARSWRHPVDETGRQKVPLTLEVLAKTPGLAPGSSVYYFEGVKKYPGFVQTPWSSSLPREFSSLPQTCEYLTFAGGWLLPNAMRAAKANIGAELSNCNREGLVYTLPLGVIRANGHLFWIVQESSWDFERYNVIEVREKDVRAALSVGGGGGCR
jgi:hypothetical protein